MKYSESSIEHLPPASPHFDISFSCVLLKDEISNVVQKSRPDFKMLIRYSDHSLPILIPHNFLRISCVHLKDETSYLGQNRSKIKDLMAYSKSSTETHSHFVFRYSVLSFLAESVTPIRIMKCLISIENLITCDEIVEISDPKNKSLFWLFGYSARFLMLL